MDLLSSSEFVKILGLLKKIEPIKIVTGLVSKIKQNTSVESRSIQ